MTACKPEPFDTSVICKVGRASQCGRRTAFWSKQALASLSPNSKTWKQWTGYNHDSLSEEEQRVELELSQAVGGR